MSYRRADVGVARAIHRLLGAFGQSVFLDVENIPLGQPWESTIDEAARAARTLVILWSRNAANSSEMRREWGVRSADCRMIPIRLDASPLPPELASLQALEGLSVAERVLARGAELVKNERLSHAKANATILRELRAEGVDLTPEQERAVGAYVGSMGRVFMAAAAAVVVWFFTRNAAAAILVPAGVVAAAGFVAGRYSQEPITVVEQRPDDASQELRSNLAVCASKTEACGTELEQCRARPLAPADCANGTTTAKEPTAAQDAPKQPRTKGIPSGPSPAPSVAPPVEDPNAAPRAMPSVGTAPSTAPPVTPPPATVDTPPATAPSVATATPGTFSPLPASAVSTTTLPVSALRVTKRAVSPAPPAPPPTTSVLH